MVGHLTFFNYSLAYFAVIPQWSRASPPAWSCRLRPGRTCWKPSWASARSFLVMWWRERRWTLWSRWCRLHSCQRSGRHAGRTWTHRRTGRTEGRKKKRNGYYPNVHMKQKARLPWVTLGGKLNRTLLLWTLLLPADFLQRESGSKNGPQFLVQSLLIPKGKALFFSKDLHRRSGSATAQHTGTATHSLGKVHKTAVG